MAVSPIKELELPIKKQLDRKLNDTIDTEHTFVGLLLAIDSYYKRGGRTFRKPPMEGGGVQTNFLLASPTAKGVDAMNPDIESLRQPLKKSLQIEGGKMLPSAYVIAETMQNYFINRLSGDEALANHILTVTDQCAKAFIRKWNDDLWPTTGQFAPNQLGGIDGRQKTDKILAAGYPLQYGGVGNVAGAAATYEYMGLNLNAAGYTAIRAVQAGDVNTAFGYPSNGNLRTKILQPMHRRSSKADLWLFGGNPYNYLVEQAEAKVQLTQMQEFTYGGDYRMWPGGILIALEHNLTDLATTNGFDEAYFFDSNEIFWANEGDTKNFKVKDDIEGLPTHMLVQGYREAMFLIRNPRLCGHAYRVLY